MPNYLLKAYPFRCIVCGSSWTELHERRTGDQWPIYKTCSRCAKKLETKREDGTDAYQFYSWHDERDGV